MYPFPIVGETAIKMNGGKGRVISCPTCGETYDSSDKIQQLLINVAHCVNLTCLEDLSDQPINAVLNDSRSN